MICSTKQGASDGTVAVEMGVLLLDRAMQTDLTNGVDVMSGILFWGLAGGKAVALRRLV